MSAPKEVWLVGAAGGLAYETEEQAIDVARHYRACVHRYVLAREKREPIAWVVRMGTAKGQGTYLSWSCSANGGCFTSCHQLALANRFTNLDAAKKYAAQKGGRVVALVRKGKP